MLCFLFHKYPLVVDEIDIMISRQTIKVSSRTCISHNLSELNFMSYSQGTRTKPKFRPQKIDETTESKATNNDVQRPKYASKTDPRKKNEEILFGFYPVLMALKQGAREFQKIYYNESSIKTKKIVDLAVQKGVSTELVSAQTLNNLAKLSTTEFTSHQGICATVGKVLSISTAILNFQ